MRGALVAFGSVCVKGGLRPRCTRRCRASLAARISVETGLGLRRKWPRNVLETFVIGEVLKQLEWLETPVQRGHWRTHDGDEVDLVLEREDGKVAALEVKAGSRVAGSELRGLMKLRRKLAGQFMGGLVLYTGTRSYSPETDLHILPIARLWQGPPTT
jgi:predicted AAA+ superfamily ATPase